MFRGRIAAPEIDYHEDRFRLIASRVDCSHAHAVAECKWFGCRGAKQQDSHCRLSCFD